MLLALRDSESVNWSGRHRAALHDAAVYPRPLQQPLPVWIAVGGTPGSVARAGMLGLPLMIAIIGGAPARFAPLVELYREAARRAEADPAKLAVGINSHMYIADDRPTRGGRVLRPLLADDEPHRARAGLAADEPRAVRRRLRPRRPPARRYPRSRWPRRSSPTTSCSTTTASSATSASGVLPHEKALHATELFATEVAPLVREARA